MFRATSRFGALAVLLAGFWAVAPAHAQVIISGFNQSLDPGPPLQVGFFNDPNGWHLEVSLLFEPTAPPMIKDFQSPHGPTGAPILLDATQPLPFLVTELFSILGTAGVPFSGQPVTDWHERILTPGWQWITPGDPNFPGLFPPGTSLITRDGQPWPSNPLPPLNDPTTVSVLFPPIDPGHVLDIHKALLWVGTDTQRIWGDDPSETFIRVIEYPTPEPSSFVLGAVGLAALAALRLRRRNRKS
jgi:MYXO-CTERM domain-containing protein